jgi:Lon protease-like protein
MDKSLPGGKRQDMTALPIFPLNTVLLPGGPLALRVFETRYVDMTRDCLRNNSSFGVCLIREGKEVGTPAMPHDVGCLASIIDCDTQQLGVFQIEAVGGQRFRINSRTVNSQGLILADVTLIPDEPARPLSDDFRNCRQLLELMLQKHGDDLFPKPHRLEDADWVSYRLAERLPIPLFMRQQLLEMEGSEQRLNALQRLLTGVDPSSTPTR